MNNYYTSFDKCVKQGKLVVASADKTSSQNLSQNSQNIIESCMFERLVMNDHQPVTT